ncbi:DUF6531 domain-containing protein [Collimonas sp. NPDC087041]|uniref:DUF6531 domain-containing protein n=1 Tax=Collimonas sp. NPDC087041 TaxID=3363960 RepID=UPI0038275E45
MSVNFNSNELDFDPRCRKSFLNEVLSILASVFVSGFFLFCTNSFATAPLTFYTTNVNPVGYYWSTPSAACIAIFSDGRYTVQNSGVKFAGMGTDGIGCMMTMPNYNNGLPFYSSIQVGPYYICSDGSTPKNYLKFYQQCPSTQNNSSPPCNLKTPYPIHAGTGNKYWSDADYGALGTGALNFSRYYNSQNSAVLNTLGSAWRHHYDRSVIFNAYSRVALVVRADGTSYSYLANGTTYTSQDGANVTDKLIGLTDANGKSNGWKYMVAADDSIEIYGATGNLLSMTDRAGRTQSMTYSDASTPLFIAPAQGLLIRVTDSYGRQLNFTYDGSSRINQMTDPAGQKYLYSYDSSNNLSSVIYPDNKTKTYLYNEAAYTGGTSLPHALTGLVDENAVRYATYSYDSVGRAVSSQHAGGVDQYQLNFSSASSTIITDPLGAARSYNYQSILDVMKGTGVSQPGGAGCSAAASNLIYDANGNVATRTDFNGTVTTYSYDLTRNLEINRVEASGTAQARTITTAWHATYRLPLKIAEPKLLTTYAYDASGNLLNKTVQATSDATGAQGLSPTLIGTARTWSYTYNNVGQVLTATGPRADVADTTTYTYDTSGNLGTITNAVGQVTTLSNYDANGRVGLITDTNGTTTALTYSPRGWLTSKTVTANGTVQSTSYSYDGVGQLTQVVLPDASTVNYTYDPAHRLTNIADSLGNSIAYTLDNMGNRISEQVKDPSGALARQTSRVVDALNRIQQITGAVQ